MLDQVGGVGAAIDSALPAIVFALVYAASGRSLRAAVWAALTVGVVLLVVRLVRREQVRNAVGGFVAVVGAAALAAVTGRAENYFLVSLGRSVALLVGYVVSNLVRYPVVGLVVGLARGRPTAFRTDPHQLRAYTRATWIWVGLFALRLVVRVPLFLTGQVTWLSVTDVVMGWPLFGLTILATYLYLRRALHAEHWADARTAILARRPGVAPATDQPPPGSTPPGSTPPGSTPPGSTPPGSTGPDRP